LQVTHQSKRKHQLGRCELSAQDRSLWNQPAKPLFSVISHHFWAWIYRAQGELQSTNDHCLGLRTAWAADRL